MRHKITKLKRLILATLDGILTAMEPIGKLNVNSEFNFNMRKQICERISHDVMAIDMTNFAVLKV